MRPAPGDPTYVVVSFHAHPDDEALLTAGTLAKAVAEGHRVVLVMATAGSPGWRRQICRASCHSATGGWTR